MKKKMYEKPLMTVFESRVEAPLLAASGVEANRSGYGTATEEEW